MTYGNKLVLVVLVLSFFLITGCSRNWSYPLYDNFKLKNIDDKTYLYNGNDKVNLNDLDYDIVEFKYNSDVVCLKLNDNNYYMIYYVNSDIYGPFQTLDYLDKSTLALAMSFDNDFVKVSKLEGRIYE